MRLCNTIYVQLFTFNFKTWFFGHLFSKLKALIFVLIHNRSTECRLEKDRSQHGSLPTSPLFHARICPPYVTRKPAVQSPYCSGTNAADLWCQEHDGCLWPTSRTLPHRQRPLQGKNVNERLVIVNKKNLFKKSYTTHTGSETRNKGERVNNIPNQLHILGF